MPNVCGAKGVKRRYVDWHKLFLLFAGCCGMDYFDKETKGLAPSKVQEGASYEHRQAGSVPQPLKKSPGSINGHQ